jgi:hypothetical protein
LPSRAPVALLISALLIALSLAFGAQDAAAAGTGFAKVKRVCPPARPGTATCAALALVPVPASDAGTPGVRSLAAEARPTTGAASGPAGGKSPAQYAEAYEYEPTKGGTGQTVAIVDAYDDPAVEGDLAKFDTQYGLGQCTTANKCFEKVGQSGTSTLPAKDETGWSVEISLDVEAVRSVCRNCKILLVEADNEEFSSLGAAVDTAVRLGATEVSNSYAGPEEGFGESERKAYEHPGVVIAAATGDDGYYDWDYYNGGATSAEVPAEPGAPASLPSVIGVGGTSLYLGSGGKRSSETVWNENGPGDEVGLAEERGEGATGSGCSTLFTAPKWQLDAPDFAASGCGTKRLSADVAADGNPQTGFDIYDTYKCGEACEEFGIGKGSGWLTIGGTSLSTPLISAMWALAGGSGGLTSPALALYGHLEQKSSIYDVTDGGDGFCGGDSRVSCPAPPAAFGTVDCGGTTACNGAAGLDGPSGVGTPSGLGLFKPLLPQAVIAPQGPVLAGSSVAFSAAESSDPYPGGSLSSYEWNWGDGTAASTGSAPKHKFEAAGKYTVTLTVIDSYGVTSSPATLQVTAYGTAEEIEAAKKKEAEAEAKSKEEEAAAKRKEEAEAKRKEEEAAAKKKEEASRKLEEEQARQGREATAKEEEELQRIYRQGQKEAEERRAEEARGRESSLSPSSPGGSAPLGGTNIQPIPAAQLVGLSLRAGASGLVRLRISCPVGETRCIGTVTLRTAAAVRADPRRKAVLALSSGSFSVAGGQAGAVLVHLSHQVMALLSRTHSLKLRVGIAARDPAGVAYAGYASATLSGHGARS